MKTEDNKKGEKKVKEFVPKRTMVNAYLAWCDEETPPTVTAMCAKANIGVTTWYDWQKKPEFLAWWKEKTEKYMAGMTAIMDKRVMMKATSDFRFMELWQMKHGGYSKKATTVNKNVTVDELVSRLDNPNQPFDEDEE